MKKTNPVSLKSTWSWNGILNPALVTALFVVVAVFSVDKGLLLLHHETALNELKRWLNIDAGFDSWHSMGIAFSWLINEHDGLLYQEVLFKQLAKFQYPPTSLLLYSTASAIGIAELKDLFNLLGWAFFLVEVVVVAALALICGRRTERGAWLAVWAVVAAFFCLTFYPAVKAYTLGQIQTWINAWFALACICWATGHKGAAGILIGAVCLIKPQFSLFLLWGGLRQQWTFLAGWAAVVLPGLAASITLFGLPNHIDYIKTLSFISAHGEAFFPNQSMNGLLNRMLANGDNLLWPGNQFAPFNPLVYAGTMLTTGAMLLLALFRPLRERSATLFDFLFAALLFTMASPIAWEHHYGILPPAFVALLFAVLALPPSTYRTSRLAFLAIAYVLSAHFLPITQSLAATPFNFVQSYLFFGAVMLAWLLNDVPDPDLTSVNRPPSPPR